MHRLSKEKETVLAMIHLTCSQKHSSTPLCEACTELWEYARERLDQCPYGDGKPTCENCPIHCYQKEMREQIREVMRYAGPRMIWHHPVMAIRHLIHSRKQGPEGLYGKKRTSD